MSAEILETFQSMLQSAIGPHPHFPPTQLFNEGWLLRVILTWFSQSYTLDYPLSFYPEADWYSEARLPSAFLPRKRKDKLAESHTNADGAIGHFNIGVTGKSDLSLAISAKQLVILEAKLFSKLSPGVTNAPTYDQAARNVGCIAEILHRANRQSESVKDLRFVLLAPESQIKKGLFEVEMDKDSMLVKTRMRVQAYEGARDGWFSEWYRPTLEKIKLSILSWEEILSFIQETEPRAAVEIHSFYARCLRFNS